MKITKIMLAVTMIMASYTTIAQYKKASVLEKDGRTYELGLAGHFMNKGRSATQGIYLGIGKETNKKLFFWYDLELLLPAKFKTTGIEYLSQAVQPITGKTKLGFILRYNWGYFLTDNNKEDGKIFPFLTFGLNYKLGGGLTLDAANANVGYENFAAPEFSGSAGLNLGGGSIFNLSKNFSIKLTGGYNYQLPKSIFESSSGGGTNIEYADFISHPYATVSVRFKIVKED
jgi:hypothetical protein